MQMSQVRQISAIPFQGSSYNVNDLDMPMRTALVGFNKPVEDYYSLSDQLAAEKLNRAALNSLGTTKGGKRKLWMVQ